MDPAQAPTGNAPPLQGLDIVCVGFADWDTDLWTNQHHLMSRLAHENRVLFVESLGLRRPQLAGRDLTRIAKRLHNGLRGPRKADGLHVLSPLVLPFHSNAFARALNRRLLPMLVRRATRSLGMRKPILWAYVPQAEALLDGLDPELVIYHCVDDIAAQPGIDASDFRAAEIRFAQRADLVLASAPALTERLQTISSNVVYAPNVADTELFATALEDGPLDHAVSSLPGPRIVFTGAVVSTKLDMTLLVALARARPNYSFALVGPVGPGDPRTDVSRLATEPNIHLLGGRSYEQLPDVLRAADVGLIPYARNQLTESIFPMKVYEYMAAGLPVLATPLPALKGVEGVATAPDSGGLAILLDEALDQDSPQRKLERSHRAASHSWDARMQEIAAAIGAIRAPARGAHALLVTSHTPALRSGRDVRTYGIARALAMDGKLTLLYVRFGPTDPDEAFKAIPGVDLKEVVPSRGIARLLAYAGALRAGVPDGLARGISPELSEAAATLASAPDCGRVIADGPTAAAALAGLARRRAVIYNAHNLESGFRHELGGGGSRAQRKLSSFEAELLGRSSESWMVSEADMLGALELCPGANLRLAPNVVDVAAIQPVEGIAPEQRAIFVANFAYEPNRNGLTFLLEEVLPHVWMQLPDARLTLVGAGLEHPPSEDPRVESLGFVDRLADIYASARCAVVPLLQGGGTPLKLIEALAYGLPVLATPRAVAGLNVQAGRDCLVAEGGEAFASSLVNILRDGSSEIARNGRKVAEERYSIEALGMLLRS